ncbi:MAG: Na+ dependent nucleoside transporter N-terminal domain-containing protein, partial [Betaproteobacteria bacterium]
MDALHSLLGACGILLLCWLLSEDRRAIAWRTVAAGMLLGLLLALARLKIPALQSVLAMLNHGANALERATEAGTRFVFGHLGGAPLPYSETSPGASFVLAFRALPLVLVVSAISALLFHWRVLPALVRGFAWMLQRALGIGGTVGLSAAANVFVGMVEAPLVVRPYL